ncbi:Uncharacterised protein [uncultured archaeon]|nr:Uncharacterised protein [uncultured archaeon]
MQNKEGDSRFLSKKNKKAQVTIFIIIGIIIVAAVAVFLVVRSNLAVGNIPANIQPVYNNFLSCLEDNAKTGISILESRGGYIELPKFEPGNSFMPFSSQLNFFGNSIPYWYYVSGNNIQKEQVPSQQSMEKSLANFINDRIMTCDYSSYYSQGFEITQDEPTASVSIKNNNVDVSVNMNMKISFGNDTSLIQNHKVSIASDLGALYNSAKIIYSKEKSEAFLENYGIDTMRLYAPVDGVELSCSPKTWNADDVFNNLKDAIETNTLALNTQNPTTQTEKYFSVSGINTDARFINSKNWTSSFEVLPSEDNLLISNPVGNQAGLGILGFCYVPYHFVYNINYPVLIQTYSGDETFQFPVAVVIKGNKPRVALNSTAQTITPDLCPYKNTQTTVKTYDSNLNSVDSQISYECFGESCGIGSTSSGTLTAKFPQCVNGFVVARADGYQESREQYSTTQEGSVNIVMNKLYNTNVNLKLGGVSYNGNAIIYFTSEGNSKVISYPQQNQVQLGEGTYEISVYIYKNSSIQLQESTQQECTSALSSGIGGIFGITEKKCFDVKIPQQMISSVLAGGGKQTYYITEDSLKNSNAIEISAEEMSIPTTIQQVQNSYAVFDTKKLEINFK